MTCEATCERCKADVFVLWTASDCKGPRAMCCGCMLELMADGKPLLERKGKR